MHLVLVRHGEVDSAFSGVFYGGTEVPLSAHGRQEAETAAHFLAGQEPIAIYSSPLTRAQYGAACVLGSCNSGGPLRIEAGLKEIDRGRWVGLSKRALLEQYPDDLAAHQADPWHWRGHGGESLADLRTRVLAVRNRILEEFGDDAGLVVLVAHMFPVRALCADVLGLDVDRWDTLAIPTGSLSWLQWNQGQPELLFMGKRPQELRDFAFPKFS